MKKSIIALAVAGALTAPMVAQADATLYGSLRLSLTDQDGADLDLADNTSRIGIKGSSELFSGAKAIYQFEQAVRADDATGWNGGRLALIGVTGDFGTAQAGQMWTPHYLWTAAVTDILDNDASGADAGFTRVGNTLAYISPNMNGFQAAAAVIADAATGTEDIDTTHVAVKYSMDGLHVAASYLGNENANTDTTALAVSYAADNFYVGARVQDDEINHGAAGDEWSIAGSYSIENTKLLASFTDEDSAADESWSLEVQQKLGKQARVFAAYRELRGVEGVEVGYRVDF
ncbi:porin [Neptuniibacter caesariensis]|uniref:Porin, Gram-negative type n=1 Tax=Neptuniibacter caesariensis TaxID=207954 RepID=A0A7U8C111_NEPCE|nr:porin [Neptuniibacter caesariensis]EAR59483.1 Porin, Gram-negative type [Oceanospirillum sp. MED92] [Neptuniibacter caesariensis]